MAAPVATSASRDLGTSRELGSSGQEALAPAASPRPPSDGNATMQNTRLVTDENIAQKLLQKERDYTNAEDARFFGEVAEYIDLLQLDAARNKKYRMDAEERERIVIKGFMEREMRYAQERERIVTKGFME